jgi:hypothetical protein
MGLGELETTGQQAMLDGKGYADGDRGDLHDARK